MVDSYRTKPDQFTSLNTYMTFRRENGATVYDLSMCRTAFRRLESGPFWSMARSGMNLSLTEAQLRSVDHVFPSVDYALVLTNDYYSWEREDAVSQRVGSKRVVNAVELYVHVQGLDVSAAKAEV